MRLRSLPHKHVVAIVWVIGSFMDVLDVTIVNVAIPRMQEDFGVTSTTIEWIVTGYLCSLAVWIPASGWIGDRFGTKRTFLFALFMFTLASGLCAISWNVEALIAFRVLQGVGGGMLVPVGTAMLFRAYPPAERARASSILAIPTVLAPALGPVLGGLLVTHASWHWIFLVNLPIGAIGFVFGLLYLEEHTEPRAGRFDVWGFALSGAGLALVLYALAEAPAKGWTSATVLVTGLGGFACFVALVVVELHLAEPMLQLRLYGNRLFRSTNIAAFAASGSLIGLLFLLPLFLQGLRGLTALQSGLATFPQAIGFMAMSQVAGRTYPIVGPRRMMIFGMAATAVVTSCFVFVDIDSSLWWVRALMFGRGMAMAFAFIPLQAASFATIPPSETGRASSLFSTQRQVGSAVGVALLATILTSRTTALVADVAGMGDAAVLDARVSAFHQAMFASALLAVAGIVASLFVRDSDAASTLVRRSPRLRRRNRAMRPLDYAGETSGGADVSGA
jgi:EmrB/QacA subfamily drug resistance transporter